MKFNVLIIGAGHYVTGARENDNDSATDKDLGILLPGLAYYQSIGRIGKITVIGRNGNKIKSVYESWLKRYVKNGVREKPRVDLKPNPGVINESEYIDVMKKTSTSNTIVFAAVPDSLHEAVVSESCANGMHIFIVKPIVSTWDSFQRLKALYEYKKNLICYIDYHKLFDPQNILLNSKVKNNDFGNVQYISSIQTQKKLMRDVYENEISQNNNFNVNHYIGCHYIHQAAYLTQATPISVRATGQSFNGIESNKLSDLGLIQVNVQWQSKEGYLFNSMHVSGWCDPNSQPTMTRQKFHLYGSRGAAELNQDDRGLSFTTDSEGYSFPNPHYFQLPASDSDSLFDPIAVYGLRSVDYFISLAEKTLLNENAIYQKAIEPNSLKGSETVTKIIDCADKSLLNNSSIVEC
ncbi:Gfo/Idh/MocA family oxidoreductase [Candidatus Pseudothioglobus singularis]|nr:Gfo/Idh/MocA family oxidoreductase [Candidatus Pseudothioglobus singularis]